MCFIDTSYVPNQKEQFPFKELIRSISSSQRDELVKVAVCCENKEEFLGLGKKSVDGLYECLWYYNHFFQVSEMYFNTNVNREFIYQENPAFENLKLWSLEGHLEKYSKPPMKKFKKRIEEHKLKIKRNRLDK